MWWGKKNKREDYHALDLIRFSWRNQGAAVYFLRVECGLYYGSVRAWADHALVYGRPVTAAGVALNNSFRRKRQSFRLQDWRKSRSGDSSATRPSYAWFLCGGADAGLNSRPLPASRLCLCFHTHAIYPTVHFPCCFMAYGVWHMHERKHASNHRRTTPPTLACGVTQHLARAVGYWVPVACCGEQSRGAVLTVLFERCDT